MESNKSCQKDGLKDPQRAIVCAKKYNRLDSYPDQTVQDFHETKIISQSSFFSAQTLRLSWFLALSFHARVHENHAYLYYIWPTLKLSPSKS
jgi:hypothetical protein